MEMFFFLGGAAAFLLLIAAAVFYPSKPAPGNRKSTLKTPEKIQTAPLKKKLTDEEREEMLDGVRNLTRNHPEAAAEALRKWMKDG